MKKKSYLIQTPFFARRTISSEPASHLNWNTSYSMQKNNLMLLLYGVALFSRILCGIWFQKKNLCKKSARWWSLLFCWFYWHLVVKMRTNPRRFFHLCNFQWFWGKKIILREAMANHVREMATRALTTYERTSPTGKTKYVKKEEPTSSFAIVTLVSFEKELVKIRSKELLILCCFFGYFFSTICVLQRWLLRGTTKCMDQWIPFFF